MFMSHEGIYSTSEFHQVITFDEIPEYIDDLRSEINNMGWLGKLFGQDKVKERKIDALKDAQKALSECHSLPVIQAVLEQIRQDKDITYSWFGKSRSFKLFDSALECVKSAIAWREIDLKKQRGQLKDAGVGVESIHNYRYIFMPQGKDKELQQGAKRVCKHLDELAQPESETIRFRR